MDDLLHSWQYPQHPILTIVALLIFTALLSQIIVNALALALIDTQRDGRKRPQPPADWPPVLQFIASIAAWALRVICAVLLLETIVIAGGTIVVAGMELWSLSSGKVTWEALAVYAVHLIIYLTLIGSAVNNWLIMHRFPGWFSPIFPYQKEADILLPYYNCLTNNNYYQDTKQ
jgi:hypothetical protein